LKTAILGTIALAALSSGRLATASTIQYRYNSFTDLGHVDAVEINDSGQVTGRGFVGQSSIPFTTGPNGANLRLISLAPHHDFGFGLGINNLGQVTGWSAGNSNRTPESPFVTAPNGDVAHYFGFRGFASDINDRGQVVGTAHRGLHDPADTPVGLFLANMNDGSFKIVSSTVFSFDSSTHLNNLGQIAGEIFVGSMIHVFVTDPDGGALHDISAPRDFSAAARDINNSGDVVGTFDLRGGSKHAFVSYDGARRIDIGALAGGGTGALGINDAGTIVGYSGPEGFIYTPEAGLQNLNSYIDPSLGIDIVAALDINNAGEILAKTSDGAEVILFPRNTNGIPDAGSTAMLFACALVGLSVLRRCLVTRCRKFIR